MGSVTSHHDSGGTHVPTSTKGKRSGNPPSYTTPNTTTWVLTRDADDHFIIKSKRNLPDILTCPVLLSGSQIRRLDTFAPVKDSGPYTGRVPSTTGVRWESVAAHKSPMGDTVCDSILHMLKPIGMKITSIRPGHETVTTA